MPDKSPARSQHSEHKTNMDEVSTKSTPQVEFAAPLRQGSPSQATSYSRPLPQRPRQNRKTSKGGGVQMVLDETGSWSELADQTATIPAEGLEGSQRGKKTGMLGFLGRKTGRDRSPKPQEPGVLGKEGARQIIN